MTKQDMKNWIDKATYRQLLTKWRFEPAGSRWFRGSMGHYYIKSMNEKKKLVDPVTESRAVGWEPQLRLVKGGR